MINNDIGLVITFFITGSRVRELMLPGHCGSTRVPEGHRRVERQAAADAAAAWLSLASLGTSSSWQWLRMTLFANTRTKSGQVTNQGITTRTETYTPTGTEGLALDAFRFSVM